MDKLPLVRYWTSDSLDEDDAILSPTSKLTWQERWRDNIQRYRLSPNYVGFCVFMVLWCLTIESYCIWMHVKGHELESWVSVFVFVSDIAVVLFIVVETSSDMIVCGIKEYWRNWWNVADFIICAFCVISLGLEILRQSYHLDDVLSISLLILRYVAQGTRVVWLLRNAQRAQAQLDVVDDTEIIMPGYGTNGTPPMPR